VAGESESVFVFVVSEMSVKNGAKVAGRAGAIGAVGFAASSGSGVGSAEMEGKSSVCMEGTSVERGDVEKRGMEDGLLGEGAGGSVSAGGGGIGIEVDIAMDYGCVTVLKRECNVKGRVLADCGT
jgi:hypothetical protein